MTVDVTYILTCPAEAVGEFARGIALEQTVEVPGAVVRAARLPASAVGDVAEITPLDGGRRHRVLIRYDADLTAYALPQLLNLLYGNISIKNKIRIVDVGLPDALLERFPGPNFGGDGLRELLGVYDRPLLATAIKPRGASTEHLAGIARDFALGGGDLIKDDHNLIDATFDAFADRVSKCQQAVAAANQQTGRQTLYLPCLMPAADQLERQLDFVQSLGIRGVLVCPFILGVDTVRRLAERYPLLFMAHPAFSGTFFHDAEHGMEPAVLLGTLLRLAGMDASVFPNHGGRFAFTVDQCTDLARALTSPLGKLKPALPVPAGGMRLESIPQMAEIYGSEAIFLIGGALLNHSDDLQASTRAFVDRVGESFTPRLVEPRRDGHSISACELPTDEPLAAEIKQVLRHRGYQWDGRTPTVYKQAAGALPFAGVARHELIGRTGEQTAFDLRYFEVEPGGYTSLEKHQHTHTIVVIRGDGELVLDDDTQPLSSLDIAYVPPMTPHQLRNAENAAEPFGFLCIVDHHRDRPQAV